MMLVHEDNRSYLQPCINSMTLLPWNPPCVLCRIFAVLILILSFISFVFNLRFLQFHQSKNHLVYSLIFASLLVLIIAVPGVLIQLLTCYRHCSEIYCRLEGFISYLSGCLCMLTLMMLAVHRYLSLVSKRKTWSSSHANGFCWLVSWIFTFPLVFNYWNKYLPEGFGFHCSLNWADQSTISRLYIFASFTVLYFLPLLCLICFSLRSHRVVQKVSSNHYLIYSLKCESCQTSSSILSRRGQNIERNQEHRCHLRQLKHRQTIRMNTQFLRAIIVLISNYLIAWTPYSIVALLQLYRVEFIFQHAYLMTLTAFIGKLSVIVTPMIYVRLMNKNLYKKIFL